jgi:ankyrin repeat protein
MGGKKAATPRKTDEEKAEEKRVKACESLLKACKDDELKKIEEAVGKGADINWQNDKGHTAAHVCAAFGALSVLRYLHRQGANLELLNEVQPRDTRT